MPFQHNSPFAPFNRQLDIFCISCYVHRKNVGFENILTLTLLYEKKRNFSLILFFFFFGLSYTDFVRLKLKYLLD